MHLRQSALASARAPRSRRTWSRSFCWPGGRCCARCRDSSERFCRLSFASSADDMDEHALLQGERWAFVRACGSLLALALSATENLRLDVSLSDALAPLDRCAMCPLCLLCCASRGVLRRNKTRRRTTGVRGLRCCARRGRFCACPLPTAVVPPPPPPPPPRRREQAGGGSGGGHAGAPAGLLLPRSLGQGAASNGGGAGQAGAGAPRVGKTRGWCWLDMGGM